MLFISPANPDFSGQTLPLANTITVKKINTIKTGRKTTEINLAAFLVELANT